jgi:hypothetical protein
MDARPMDIDPIDDGPRQRSKPQTTVVAPANMSEEEEARQNIDMLRGEDLSARIAAANRLDAVAKTLGVERTREVSPRNHHVMFMFMFMHDMKQTSN